MPKTKVDEIDSRPSETIGRYKRELQETQSAQIVQTKQRERVSKRNARHEKWEAEGDEKWKKFEDHYITTMERGQQGYDTWISAMFSIITGCYLMVQAGDAYNPAIRLLERAVNPVVDFLGTQFFDIPELRPIELPDLMYRVGFTDDNKLDIPSLTKNILRSDGVKFREDELQILQESMCEGLKAWLKTHGYEPKPGTDNEFEDPQAHTQLTKQKFEELRQDPNNGLDQFFTSRFNMIVEHQGARPGP